MSARRTDRSETERKAGLRMKDLVEATGLAKSAILHYLHEGLLPEPVKTSPNMAWYDPSCVQRIRLIRHLQRMHRLSLADVRRVLDNRAGELDQGVYAELNDLIFGAIPDPGNLLSLERFCEETGLTPEKVRALTQARLLLPLMEDHYDPDDVNMGRLFAAGAGWGATLEDMAYYVEFGEKIVDREMAFRHKLTHHLPYNQDAAFTMELVKRARMMRAYIIDRLFQHRIAALRDLKDKGARDEEVS